MINKIYQYKFWQWNKHLRFKFSIINLTIWKWSGIYFPLVNFYVGDNIQVGYDIFHNGAGIKINFMPFLIVNFCIAGKLGWWYKKGAIRILICKREWNY